jgi:LysR family transcriptional regulator, benzoate and cis,cis-muconate-responsive activator of ben and cat genes
MELRQLRYFVTVAAEGNISRAAQKIFLTQPALSRQMKALEDELGVALLVRKANSIQLTPAGDTLLDEARQVLARAELAAERVRAAGSGPHLRVGYAPSLAAGFLSTAILQFTQAHPRARVELFDVSSVEALTGLAESRFDLIITVAPATPRHGFVVTPLHREPWRVALSRTHPLARKKQISAADLARFPLLTYCRAGYPEYREAVEAWFRGHQTKAHFGSEFDGAESLMAAVEAGLGVALVTGRMARLFPHRVLLRPLAQASESFCVAAIARADRAEDKSLSVLIEELRQTANAVA